MDISMKNFKENPFKNNEEFPYATSRYSVIDPDIKIKGENQKMKIDTPIRHRFKMKKSQSDLIKSVNFSGGDEKQYNMRYLKNTKDMFVLEENFDK